MNFSPQEGAGNAGRPMRPIAACAEVVGVSTRVSQVTPESPGIPHAMVLTASFVLSPAIGLFCHRRPRKLLPANLTPASRRQDHTTSPSASQRLRLWHRQRPPHPAPTFVTMANAPLRDGMAGDKQVICAKHEAEYFFDEDWTGQISLIGLGNFDFARKFFAVRMERSAVRGTSLRRPALANRHCVQ
jgi:hypothetical protein